MVRFYPVYYYQRPGKKGRCPVFAQVVSPVYPNYQDKKGIRKSIDCDNVESLVGVLSFLTPKYPIAHDYI